MNFSVLPYRLKTRTTPADGIGVDGHVTVLCSSAAEIRGGKGIAIGGYRTVRRRSFLGAVAFDQICNRDLVLRPHRARHDAVER